MKNRMSTPAPCFNRFLMILSLKLEAPNPKIIEILLCFIAFKRLRPFRVHVRFGVHFCLTLAPP